MKKSYSTYKCTHSRLRSSGKFSQCASCGEVLYKKEEEEEVLVFPSPKNIYDINFTLIKKEINIRIPSFPELSRILKKRTLKEIFISLYWKIIHFIITPVCLFISYIYVSVHC